MTRTEHAGTRPSPFQPKTERGGPYESVSPGGVIANANLRNFGIALMPSGKPSPHPGFTVENIAAWNVYRFIETRKSQLLENLVVRNVFVEGAEKGIVRIFKGRNATIEDVHGIGKQIDEPFGIGLHFEALTDSVIRRCRMENFWAPETSGYRNGDGFADEGASARLFYEDCIASNNADGGFDLKSTDLLMDRCTARGNGRNFRFWGTGTIGTIISETPRGSHVGFFGNAPRYTIAKLVVRSTEPRPILLLDAAATVHIEDHDIQTPPGTPLLRTESSGSRITWGPKGAPAL